MKNGWITLHRKIKDSPIYKDSQAFHVWCHLLMSANHKNGDAIVGSQIINVERGQLVTGRKSIAYATGVNTSKVQRLLKMFEKLGQIEQQTFNKYRLISITNFDSYQDREQQVNSKRTASEQQMNTNNNINNGNNVNKKDKTVRFAPPSLQELQIYISEKQLTIDAEGFINFYESKDWMVGKNKMKSWKASARGWNSRNKSNGGNNGKRNNGSKTTSARFMDNMRDTWND